MWLLRDIEFTRDNLLMVLAALKRLEMNTVDFCQDLEMAIRFGTEKDDQLLICCKDADQLTPLVDLLGQGLNLIKLRRKSAGFTKLFFQDPDILSEVRKYKYVYVGLIYR
jgi:hypothetical protein